MDPARCTRCHHPHLVGIPCWSGRYAQRVAALVLATQGTTCWLCGTGGANTADHVTPRSKGGTDNQANLRPAHKRCNSARSNRDPFMPDPLPLARGPAISARWGPWPHE